MNIEIQCHKLLNFFVAKVVPNREWTQIRNICVLGCKNIYCILIMSGKYDNIYTVSLTQVHNKNISS